MGKNSTKAEKAKRNKEYALSHKKKVRPTPRFNRPSGPSSSEAPSTTPGLRASFQAICGACGAETTVPFEPTSGKPVYCRNCFQAKARA